MQLNSGICSQMQGMDLDILHSLFQMCTALWILSRRTVRGAAFSSFCLIGKKNSSSKGCTFMNITTDLAVRSLHTILAKSSGSTNFKICSMDRQERFCCTGGTVSRDAGPVKGGTTEIAFVKDPTGYSWEIIQRKDQKIREPIAQVQPQWFRI